MPSQSAQGDWFSQASRASESRDREFVASSFFSEALRLEAAQGPAARAHFVREALARLVEVNRPRIDKQRLPESVKTRTHKEFDRISRDLEHTADEHYDLNRSMLRCDYRIVGFNRIPIGVEHLEVGGVPRRLLWSGGPVQALRLGRGMLRAHGWKPFYVAHLSHGIKPWTFLMAYNSRTQIAWQNTAAECLLLNPHIRGVLATSWWYDPQVSRVAPHLAFLRDGSLAHGAIAFRAGEPENARKHALANSPERQRLYEAGSYTPINHGVLWTRKALLDWSDRHRSDGVDAKE